jgi:pimeloyl-ACP methyl ester carboxylesterase
MKYNNASFYIQRQNPMIFNTKKAVILVIITLLIFGCTQKRPDDGIITEGTVHNSTSGELNIPYIEGYTTTNTTELQLWYDVFGDRDNPKVLLIHGNEAQAVSWMPHFYEPLVNAGFCVIRFDQRGNGLSENIDTPKGFKPGKWTPEQAPPYTLEDMADDVFGLLENLDIETVHIVGHSMGGMIAQLIAIRQPEIVKTLTLLATTPSHAFDDTYQSPQTLEFFEKELAGMIKKMILPSIFMPLSRKQMIKQTTLFFRAMDNDLSTPQGEKRLNEYMDAYFSNGRTFNLMSWQGMAAVTSKSREDELKGVRIPTLIVHGDKDKLFDYATGKALATYIPNAKLITIEDGGHMFPQLDIYNSEYIDEMIKHFQREQ